MNYTINPFQQLYFSDDPQSENNFAQLFSEVPLQAAINPIFQGGNVVLLGTQGCGKTMILSLLRPDTRIAFAKSGKEFPVPKGLRDFVSAGVNLTKSGITELVQITLGNEDADQRELPLYFADFFNYWLVDDLLKTVEVVGKNRNIFGDIIDTAKMLGFVKAIVTQDCWFGALEGATSFEGLRRRVAERIETYRRWVNGNLAQAMPSKAFQRSKTRIGEPIAQTALCLRTSGVISDDVPVLIRVDQIEELHRAFTDRQRKILFAFRKVINRAFAGRDARVHYRAGSRRYGWNRDLEFLAVWGSESRLEERRDYIPIDMDEELFARGEVKNSVFDQFAADAFMKRVCYYFRGEANKVPEDIAKRVFGKSPAARDRLESLNKNPNDPQIGRALGLNLAAEKGRWSAEWLAYLHDIYKEGAEGMLDAALAAAWGRQTGGGQHKKEHRDSPPPENSPWRERKWWRKERLDQAVLQLLTRNQQRFVWWGIQDILSLSGANITVFLHVCHRIWDAFLKQQSSLPERERIDLFLGGEIKKDIQSAGILFASNEWFRKLPEEPGGDERQRFVEELGKRLNGEMMNDLAMRYPGGNGVSVVEIEFLGGAGDMPDIRLFMRDAVGFGALWETVHSSKTKKSGRRIKFYLNPILCPRFQLPEAKTKEPYYWTIDDLRDLVKKAKVSLDRASTRPRAKLNAPYLFPEWNKGTS